MKKIVAAFFIVHIGLASYGQKPSCKSVRDGVFKSVNSVTGITIITRKGNIQTEVNEKFGITCVFNVTWIDECTYQLKVKEVIGADINKEEVITSRIMNVTNSFCIVKTSSSNSNLTLESKLEFIK